MIIELTTHVVDEYNLIIDKLSETHVINPLGYYINSDPEPYHVISWIHMSDILLNNTLCLNVKVYDCEANLSIKLDFMHLEINGDYVVSFTQ